MPSQSIQAGYMPNNVNTGNAACEGRKSITTIIDFSIAPNFTLDLTQIQQMQVWIKSVQCLYIDNSANSDPVTIIMGVTNQKIIFPPMSQGYIPILQPNPPVLQFSCPNPVPVTIQVLNFFLPPYIWGPNGTVISGTVIVSDPILDSTVVASRVNTRELPGNVILTDRSGTITAGGVGQILMAANATRLRWKLANPTTAAEILQYSYHSIAGPWYDLAAGQAIDETECVSPQELFVIAATTAHAFTADEG